MPFYNVEAVESFEFRTSYFRIEADSPEEAVEFAKEKGWDDRRSIDGCEWVETVSVQLDDDQETEES
jgi:hypothetical protein